MSSVSGYLAGLDNIITIFAQAQVSTAAYTDTAVTRPNAHMAYGMWHLFFIPQVR